MFKMAAITVCRVGGKRYKPGETIEVTDEDVAAELEVSGSAKPASKEEALSDEDRAEKIASAVETLSDADWTSGGTPKVAAVEKASGLTGIKADELAGFKKPEA